MAVSVTELIRFLVRGGLLSALKAATGSTLRPLARELTIATDVLSMRVGTGAGEYVDLPVLNPVGPSFQFRTKTSSTTDADPGNGFVKWNNATHASATVLYFDLLTSNTGTDLTTFFASLGVGVASTGVIHMVQEEDRSKWQLWKWTAITTATGYRKFTVVLQASTGTFADNLAVRVQFLAPMPTGVVAGSYTSADITVGPDGRITSAANGAGGGGTTTWTTIPKLADESRTNNTTPSDDAELKVVLAAGKLYRIKLSIFYDSTSASPDIKVTNNYTGTLTSVIGVRKIIAPGAGSFGTATESALIANGAFTSSTVAPGFMEWEYALLTNTTGTFSFQFAQNTSGAVPVVVKAGSFLQYSQFN